MTSAFYSLSKHFKINTYYLFAKFDKDIIVNIRGAGDWPYLGGGGGGIVVFLEPQKDFTTPKVSQRKFMVTILSPKIS